MLKIFSYDFGPPKCDRCSSLSSLSGRVLHLFGFNFALECILQKRHVKHIILNSPLFTSVIRMENAIFALYEQDPRSSAVSPHLSGSSDWYRKTDGSDAESKPHYNFT